MDKFKLYLEIKEQKRKCDKYLKPIAKEIKAEREAIMECECEMA